MKNTGSKLLRWMGRTLVPNFGTLLLVLLVLTVRDVAATGLGLLPPPTSSASVADTFSYQGYLTSLDGTPINGNRTLTFRIYTAPTGSNPLWSEVRTALLVTDGLFTVRLGELSPIPSSIWDNVNLYLGVQLDSEPELSPRDVIGLTPVAQRALRADSAITATTANTANQATLALSVPDGSITSAKLNPTVGRVALTTNTNLTTSPQVLVSATINVSQPARLLILPTADFVITEGTAVGKIIVDGQEISGQLLFGSASGDSDTERATVSNTHIVSIGTGQHTISLTGAVLNGIGVAGGGHTGFTYVVLSQ